MTNDKKFEICLADGKIASFENANELAGWYDARTPLPKSNRRKRGTGKSPARATAVRNTKSKNNKKRPRRAVRSARHPVKVEAAGSNPVEGARGKSLLELRRRKAR